MYIVRSVSGFLNSFKQKKRYASLRMTSLLQHYCVILFTTSLPPRIVTSCTKSDTQTQSSVYNNYVIWHINNDYYFYCSCKQCIYCSLRIIREGRIFLIPIYFKLILNSTFIYIVPHPHQIISVLSLCITAQCIISQTRLIL